MGSTYRETPVAYCAILSNVLLNCSSIYSLRLMQWLATAWDPRWWYWTCSIRVVPTALASLTRYRTFICLRGTTRTGDFLASKGKSSLLHRPSGAWSRG